MPGIISELLCEVPLPRVVPVRQEFERTRVDDVAAVTSEQIRSSGILDPVKANAAAANRGSPPRVAITAGSRGIAGLPQILRACAEEVRRAGADPFVIPAMGSHGGATAGGQLLVLEGLGVTEASAGAPIVSSVEVVEVGRTDDGLPVLIDRAAAGADAILLVNTVKPHVSYRGRYESGLFKMMAIGLGKQHGAQICHDLGFTRMAQNVEAIARVVLNATPILGGVAIVENAYHETAAIEAIPACGIATREPELLEQAWRLMPRLPVNETDVLVIDRIGKDIAGTGFNTNVVGRYSAPHMSGGPDVHRLVVLGLTSASHGNANGVGIADFTTERLFRAMSFEDTYPNALTSTVPTSAKLPMVLPTDRLAIQAAIRTSNVRDKREVRLVRIRDTLGLDAVLVSENLLPDVAANPRARVAGDPRELAFDEHGTIVALDFGSTGQADA